MAVGHINGEENVLKGVSPGQKRIVIIIIIIIIIIIKTYLCRITISVIKNCYQHGSCVKKK